MWWYWLAVGAMAQKALNESKNKVCEEKLSDLEQIKRLKPRVK